MRRLLPVFPVLLLCLGACGPGAAGPQSLQLENSAGKADAVSLRVRLSESSPVVGLGARCDADFGCEGWVELTLISPAPCELIEDPRCGIGGMQAATRALGTITVTSRAEGERVLPFELRTGDGAYLYASVSADFAAESYEEVQFLVERAEGTPPLLVAVRAEWSPNPQPGVDTAELEAFLAEVPGLTFSETSTAYPGYRAYALQYEQPLDHEDPEAGTFVQSMVLHHRDRGAPLALYTTGYELSFGDYLAELTEAMGANQISTEQRFFGNSVPAGMTPDHWRFVNIRQAAADHHRIVEALKPFYQGSWLSTGHSKGGMTSIYHRRFYPDDVDATIAYVAPISFTVGDPRYIPFLDAIGEADCRDRLRALQRALMENFATIQPRLEEAAVGQTFERAGGHASALEKTVVTYEWGFWQGMGVEGCPTLPEPEMSAEELASWAEGNLGTGWGDLGHEWLQTYYYQAVTELGLQSDSTAHLEGLLQYVDVPYDYAPAGTEPVHDPGAMQDVQKWVLEQGERLLFLYGAYDPWTGGAFETGERDGVVRFDVARANHGALLRQLDEAARQAALDHIEHWTGQRPTLADWTPRHAPLPPGLLDRTPRP